MSKSVSTVIETSQAAFEHAPLPDGWRWVKLFEIADRLPTGTQFDRLGCKVEGTVPVIDQSEKGYMGFHDEEAGVLASEEHPVVTFANHTCAVRLHEKPFSTIQNVFALKGKEGVDTRFLYWLLMNRVPQSFYGGHYPKLIATDLPLPPPPEQERIAATLKEQMATVERARAAAEAQLKAAKDLPAAYLRETFESPEAQEWQEKKIGEICAVTKLAGFEYTKYVKYIPDGEYIALRAQNVRNEGLDLRNVVRISREVASVLYRSKLDKNDVVMTFIGANIGEATWVDESDTFYCAPNIAKITPHPEFIDHRFLTLAIQSRPFQQQIQEINASTAQQSLSMRDIRNFTVPVPSLEKQRHIAAKFLEYRLSAKLLREKLQEQLDAIYPLPATLLRQAFTGKL